MVTCFTCVVAPLILMIAAMVVKLYVPHYSKVRVFVLRIFILICILWIAMGMGKVLNIKTPLGVSFLLCSHQESNLDREFRKLIFYPLNYGSLILMMLCYFRNKSTLKTKINNYLFNS